MSEVFLYPIFFGFGQYLARENINLYVDASVLDWQNYSEEVLFPPCVAEV